MGSYVSSETCHRRKSLIGCYQQPERSPVSKTWLTVTEDDGFIEIYGPDGTLVASHKRTSPSDHSKDHKWAEELVTDISMVTRAAITTVLKQDKAQARFTSSTPFAFKR